MKKIVLIGIAFLGFSTIMMAQDISENALGLRLGDSDGFGAEISYQRAVGSNNNRLEFDLGFRSRNKYNGDGFKLAGIYQWVWNIDGGFNWYAGPGVGLASYNYDKNHKNNNEFNEYKETFLFLAGDIGIEYNFDIPLLISLDFRPEFGFGNDHFGNDELGFDIAFGIRYQF